MFSRISSRFSNSLCGGRPVPGSFIRSRVLTAAAAVLLAGAAIPQGRAQSQLANPADAQLTNPANTTAADAFPDNNATSAKPAKPHSLDRTGEINLIRGLSSEVAVAKIPLPRGKHGIYLDSQGKIDQAKARDEVKTYGVAVNPGTPIEISKIVFHENRLMFVINGGGKSGTHWYQHIEVGMGTQTAPIAPVDPNQSLAYGSYITLRFPGRVPELTVDQAKLLLANVLDFHRHSPTVLYSPAVPPQFKEAIKNHKVLIGMDHDAVLSAKGPPDRKVREDAPNGSEKEDWIYGLPPHVLFVTFDGDNVVSVHQY
ncbi:MAG TPA: hypothetical protein VGZ29_10555 [Terriglobia bacterium]|nr:hypothetical protein [Terriglobia bacterium]